MADSIREQIISAMTTKLAKIRKKYGYTSDCGRNVFRGLPVPLHEDFFPALSIIPVLEASEGRHGRDFRIMQVHIQAVKLFGSENPSEISEQLLADIIECIQGIVWTLGYDSGGTNIPVPGDSALGETSSATAIVESVTLNGGAWAGGNAAGDLALRRLSGEFSNNEELTIAGNSGVVTVDGLASGEDGVASTTGGLAELIEYVSGGLENYPEHNDKVVGATTVFNVGFKTKVGDPYSQ
jgi:hypothetical protein